jgi:hypothetical protein
MASIRDARLRLHSGWRPARVSIHELPVASLQEICFLFRRVKKNEVL